MRLCEFSRKEVINASDCRCLGNVCDLEFDECSGRICSVTVPGNNKFCNLLKSEPDYCIPYKDIKQIGPDIIIVDVCG